VAAYFSLPFFAHQTNRQAGRLLAERLFQAGVGSGVAAGRRDEEKR